MTKELHREIMKRSRLHNNYLRIKSQENRLKYNKLQNFCKKLLRTAKKLVDKLIIEASVSIYFYTLLKMC